MNPDQHFDPFQVFEVSHKGCAFVHVNVVRGRKITKGWAKDLMDTPDPYVILTLANSPYAWRKTTVKDNDINPEWHETFTFWLDPDQEHTLEMSLMDANYTVDEHLATRSLSISPLPVENRLTRTIQFNETSEVDIEVWAELKEGADLRFSLTLCQEEKNFIEARKRKILRAMKNHYGFASPRSYKEVPVLGIIGSGGGFRAMTAYSGVISALSKLGVLDMATYVAGLSGSAWYLSQLYSHEDWPNLSPSKQRDELMRNIDYSFLWLFRSHGITFVKEVWRKRSRGEPVSFTDLFGHLVGNTLLKNRLDSRLSDQQKKVNEGQCPLPLYTCLHVKKAVSAMIFHEWIEFSPYEIGLMKYGTFIKVEQFSCKFFMGSIIRHFPEPPLHFLQGIWGSAFCIQFKRLLQDDKNVDAAELIRREREEFEEELKRDMASCDQDESESSDDENPAEKGTHGEKTTGGLQRKRSKSTKMKQKSFWDSMISRVMESRWFQSIELRAAQVFNFMRGLPLNKSYPISPFTQTQEEEDDNNKATFGGIFDLHPHNLKKLYVVDSGLTFNSPFPVLLRPQREVDIILSFDFSARPSDDTPPFKELLLAAKWAELNKIPFPPIDPTIVEREGLKECYVFKHPWDPNCPIVLHFCLVNINFKRETEPGVCRTTKEELDFGNFSIFDDPTRPYSTFKFTYTHLEFERLSKLMEYNTLLSQKLIFDNIQTCIKRRRRFSIRRPCTMKDISRLSLSSKANAKKLADYINMVEKVAAMNAKDEQQDVTAADTVEYREVSSVKSRPVSSPVHFPEEEDHSEENSEVGKSKLQRSTVSLRDNLRVVERRRHMNPAMSEVEEVDEQEESTLSVSTIPPSTSPTPPRSPVSARMGLPRSRPVSASMKSSMSSNRSEDIPSIVKDNTTDSTAFRVDNKTDLTSHLAVNDPQATCPVPSPRLKKKLRNQLAGNTPPSGDQQRSVSPATGGKTNGNSDSGLTSGQSNEIATQSATEAQSSNDMTQKLTQVQNGVDKDRNVSNLNPLEEWIDSAERVTQL